MKRFSKIIVLILVCLTVSVETTNSKVLANDTPLIYNDSEIFNIAHDIINWKKLDNHTPTENLINNSFFEIAGTSDGDWFPIGISRLNIIDDYDGYLSALKENVKIRYKNPEKLSKTKATEWHRISLAVLAMGGDPTNLIEDEEGKTINLIADGTYNREKTMPLDKQGINGLIWGLISLDSKRYTTPDDCCSNRDDIIKKIIAQQLTDGGFSLDEDKADPNITAMVIQALSPYYNEEKIYSDIKDNKTVHLIIDEALTCLSKLQLKTGDFQSHGVKNIESTNQVIIALCSLGIDPQTDKRFIKNNNTLINAILKYRMPDGGFSHSYIEQNSPPDNYSSDSMASEQTLSALASIIRQMNNQRTLYDFREEHSSELKNRISQLENKIDKLSDENNKSTLEELLKNFYSIKENERNYVDNYWVLSTKAKKSGIIIQSIADNTLVIDDSEKVENPDIESSFSEKDKKIIDELLNPSNIKTTEPYYTITKLLEKLNKSEDFSEKENYIIKLQSLKKEIEQIQNEINSINTEILENIKSTNINDLINRYNLLSEYDKTKINGWEDVIKIKTINDNSLRAFIISIILIIVLLFSVIMLIIRIKKRNLKKQEDE